MFFYWVLFLIPVYFLLGQTSGGSHPPKLVWQSFGFFLIWFIGLRHHVGGDWVVYLENIELIQGIPLEELINARTEPGYTFISWLSLLLGANIYGVNFICAAIFTMGLLKLSRAQPYPWLAIVVAVPYLVIVVAMGYVRQGTAIGLLMFAFGYLLQGRITAYLTLVAMAGLFHKTALVFIVFPLFRPGGGLFRLVLGIGLFASLAAGSYLLEQVEDFRRNYVENLMESEGGYVRVLMNALPALILFAYWKEWGKRYRDRWLWGLIALLALACIPLVSIASTAVDRAALYLIPLQLVVWSRFPVLVQGRIRRNSVFLMVIFYCAAVQFVWIVFGLHSEGWLPYDNLFFPSF